MASSTTLVEEPKGKSGHKFFAVMACALMLVMVAVVFFSHRGLYQIYHLRHERLLLEQENARLAEENARLTRTVDRLQHDPEMIQEFIRRELNFVKKNEIIFQLPPGSQRKTSTVSSATSALIPEKPLAKPEAAPKKSGLNAWVWQFLEGALKLHPPSTK